MLRDRAVFTLPSRHRRVLVLLSALLLLFMGVAQAAHSHGSWTEATRVVASSDLPGVAASDCGDSDPGCLLCMVSHSALPSFPALIGRLTSSAKLVSFVFKTTEPRGFWSYNLFSRPPPQA